MTTEEYNEDAAALRPVLRDMAAAMLKNADDADDAVQDVLLKLWNMHTELCRPIAPLTRVLLRNLCIDRLRRRHTEVSTDAIELPAPAADSGTELLMSRIMSVIDTLPSNMQVVLRLRHMEGMSVESIASLTGCSKQAVYQALSRARRAVLRNFSGGDAD